MTCSFPHFAFYIFTVHELIPGEMSWYFFCFCSSSVCLSTGHFLLIFSCKIQILYYSEWRFLPLVNAQLTLCLFYFFSMVGDWGWVRTAIIYLFKMLYHLKNFSPFAFFLNCVVMIYLLVDLELQSLWCYFDVWHYFSFYQKFLHENHMLFLTKWLLCINQIIFLFPYSCRFLILLSACIKVTPCPRTPRNILWLVGLRMLFIPSERLI